MQIASSLSANASIYPTATASTSATTSTTTKKPEDFLTDADVKMIEYVSGTTSLDAAEQDPNAKILAVSLGTQRENGWIQGDAGKGYFYSQLTNSDAKMIERMTGTTNIIDAIFTADNSTTDLVIDIAMSREDGSLTGNITPDYLNNIIAFDKDQIANYGGAGIGTSLDTLNQALAYVKSNAQTTDPTAGTSSTYSATA
jgi:hypothetical protein